MKRWSSLRRTAAPIPVAVMAVSFVDDALSRCEPLISSRSGRVTRLLSHGLGAGGDRLDDVVITGTAAEIAFELMADGAVIEIMALATDHVDGGHDHPGRAIAALQTVMLAECLLHGMQRSIGVGQALD